MLPKILLAASAALCLAATTNAEGLYPKNSAVLQVSGKSYDKLIAKSNQVSIVEFYAPWCGHCKNLKPEYEKAAKGLKDLAQVAAVNCDEESNKAFCGSMGVQGFPTLKIVKPAKKPGNRGIVEDYNGPRESKGIIEAVKSAIPNNVKRITDKGLEAWLNSNNDEPKAILFSDKGTTGALIKVVATEYLGKIGFAQIRDKEAAAVEKFSITDYPTLIVLPGGSQDPVKYDGPLTRTAMKSFLDPHVPSTAIPGDTNQKPLNAKEKSSSSSASKDASSTFASASASHASAEASESASSINLDDDEDSPTPSPDPAVTPDSKPIPLPQHPPIPAMLEQKFLQQKCLADRTSTCVLALLPKVEGEDAILPEGATTALASLAEVADKHKERGSKLFPILSVPARNTGNLALRDALKLDGEADFEMIAVNARRGWWRRYSGDGFGSQAVENWIDNIRFGEGAKEKLPEELIVGPEQVKEEKQEEEGQLKMEWEEIVEPGAAAGTPGKGEKEPGLKIQVEEVVEETAAPTHGEL